MHFIHNIHTIAFPGERGKGSGAAFQRIVPSIIENLWKCVLQFVEKVYPRWSQLRPNCFQRESIFRECLAKGFTADSAAFTTQCSLSCCNQKEKVEYTYSRAKAKTCKKYIATFITAKMFRRYNFHCLLIRRNKSSTVFYIFIFIASLTP